MSAADVNGAESSPAERLLRQHTHNHNPTVEDVPDEELQASSSAAAEVPAAHVKSVSPAPRPLDTQSHEAFPELGAPKGKAPANVAPIWSVKGGLNGKSNGTSPVSGTPRSSTPASGISTPLGGVPNMTLPGRNVETIVLEPQYILHRSQLKRPIPDIVKDINRRSRAVLSTSNTGNGRLRIDAVGPQDKAQQAIRDLVDQIGTRQTIKVPIPRSARAHIIGKQGSTIKSIQEKTGARIHLDKDEGNHGPVDDDDDSLIDVEVEGNTITAADARQYINKIVGERSANVSSKLKTIPTELYPFIAGANNNLVHELESNHGVHIRVPPLQPWSVPVPEASQSGDRPVFVPHGVDNPIQLAGDRAAVAAARAAIEASAQELRDQLRMDQGPIPRGRHQFIIGEQGIPMEEFFAATNCVVMLPTDEDDTVTIIGREGDLQRGMDKAIDLAMGMQLSNMSVSKILKGRAGVDAAYTRDVARYLRQRREIERLEQLHGISINTPVSDGTRSWEIYSRDGKAILKAQKEMTAIIEGHPPSRLTSVAVDPFFHSYLRSDVQPQVQSEYGVYLVVPNGADADLPIVLVYEGQGAQAEGYQIPQKAPSAQDIKIYQQSLADARKCILDILTKQEELKTETLDVPAKYHEKLRRYIKKEQDTTTRSAGEIPVRVNVKGTTVTLRGPTSGVESLTEKAKAFVEQEKEDEKERGFTMKFDFPQKFANHLIGKGGSHIKELREKFDVEIQVENGEVELKGPKAKAERAKAHINSLARTWADETTHTLKIEPKYHRELIGAQGAQINRLQTRYGVHINFPRTARPGKEDESSADAASEAGKPTRRQQGADEVVIRGPKKGADEARDEIFSLYQYLKDNSFTATVSLHQRQLPSLIGAGGSGIDELRQATGARIDIPSERNEDPNAVVEVEIKGTKAQVGAAKKLIQEKKTVFEDTVVKTIDIDRKWHKFLIGPQGSTLRDIIVKAGGPEDRRLQNRCIQFPKQDADGDTITVEGRHEIVDKIIAAIKTIVSERESQVEETIDVPIEKHRTLIGRGGDAKHKLENEFKVSIDIPRQGSGQTGVKIRGLAADVEKCKARIATVIKEQQGETLQVPRKYHNAISENGQFFRRLRNEYHVTVDHAGHKVPAKTQPANARANGSMPLITDDPEQAEEAHLWSVVENVSNEEGDIPWVLKGSQENIERAKKAIATALEHAQKSSFIGYLTLNDPSTYRYVIGQGGSKVNAIRKQSGCRIQVPRDHGRDEAIEIVGSKEGCETAKELILKAVAEGRASRHNRDRERD